MTTLTLPLDTLALPPGYTTRPLALTDAEAIAALFTAASAVRGDGETFNPQNLLDDWQSPDFDLATASLGVLAPDGSFAAMMTVWDRTPPPVHPWVEWDVHPDHHAHFDVLARFVLASAEQRARQAIDRCPPEARVSWKTGVLSTMQRDIALLEALGMVPLRYFNRMLIHMQEEPAAPVLPAGISITTYRHPEDLVRMVAAKDEAWRDHFGYVARPLAEVVKDWEHHIATDNLFDPSLWFLAIDTASGEIAGLVLARRESWEEPAVAYVEIVATRAAWRGRGIAAALLQQALVTFWQRQRHTVTLFVDSSSPTGATRLYERAGMSVSRQYIQYEKELRPGVELANQ
ncbi:MAG: GNAT family N-acetyltransferase [Anaerolineae bacterium]|jgi:ribosomal protein S18 acetylase RimI-like enzyme|nr:GNAT family N-acetyltransferase [Anaerolineae bacterium]